MSCDIPIDTCTQTVTSTMDNILCSCHHLSDHKKCACDHNIANKKLWILDSGASMHFTPDWKDFDKHYELSHAKRIPVRTANGIIFVVGRGHVLVWWLDQDQKIKILNLHNIGHIPNSDVHLVSLGFLLNHGAKIHGDMEHLTVTYSDGTPLACFIPGHMGPGMYTVEEIPPTAKDHAQTSKITYDIFPKHFGHPLKEVIWHAKKHVTNMPEIEIPSEDSICPGYTKGKLPNWAFPPIERRATHAFKLIHSDLKSFPIKSYHHHWYIHYHLFRWFLVHGLGLVHL